MFRIAADTESEAPSVAYLSIFSPLKKRKFAMPGGDERADFLQFVCGLGDDPELIDYADRQVSFNLKILLSEGDFPGHIDLLISAAEDKFDLCERRIRVFGVMLRLLVNQAVFLLEVAGKESASVESPEKGVEQCGLSETVLSVDYGYVPLLIAAEDYLLAAMELTEVLERKFF